MLEQFARAALNIVVGIYVARYLGPSQFGLFNYIISIVTVAAAIARLGVDGILVRELIVRPGSRALDLGVAFWLMASGAIVTCGLLIAVSHGVGGADRTLTYMLLALPLVLVQPFSVVDLFCQAEVKAMIPAACRIVVMVLGALLKIAAIVHGQELITFFVITLVEQLVLAALYIAVSLTFNIPFFWSRFSVTRGLEMLRSSWPMLVTAIAMAVQIRITQILINILMDDHAAGVFAAASRVYEAWIYVPYVCVISLAPALLNARAQSEARYNQRLALLIRFLFWTSAGIAICFLLFGRWILAVTFGEAYLGAQLPLVILMCASALAAIGSVTGRYFVIERREGAFAIRTLVAAGANIALSLVLIPILGEAGASLSVLISVLLANYGILWVNDRDKTILNIVNRAVLLGKIPVTKP